MYSQPVTAGDPSYQLKDFVAVVLLPMAEDARVLINGVTYTVSITCYTVIYANELSQFAMQCKIQYLSLMDADRLSVIW